MPPGTEVTIPFAVSLISDVPDSAEVSYTITLGPAGVDPKQGNNTESATIAVKSQADLAVEIVGDPQVQAGGVVTYKVYLTNKGPSTAKRVKFGLDLPTLLSSAKVVASGVDCHRDGEILFLKIPAAQWVLRVPHHSAGGGIRIPLCRRPSELG